MMTASMRINHKNVKISPHINSKLNYDIVNFNAHKIRSEKIDFSALISIIVKVNFAIKGKYKSEIVGVQ
jgi:hypothetical protein